MCVYKENLFLKSVLSSKSLILYRIYHPEGKQSNNDKVM